MQHSGLRWGELLSRIGLVTLPRKVGLGACSYSLQVSCQNAIDLLMGSVAWPDENPLDDKTGFLT